MTRSNAVMIVMGISTSGSSSVVLTTERYHGTLISSTMSLSWFYLSSGPRSKAKMCTNERTFHLDTSTCFSQAKKTAVQPLTALEASVCPSMASTCVCLISPSMRSSKHPTSSCRWSTAAALPAMPRLLMRLLITWLNLTVLIPRVKAQGQRPTLTNDTGPLSQYKSVSELHAALIPWIDGNLRDRTSMRHRLT